MHSQQINSFSEFVDKIEVLSLLGEFSLFRGQDRKGNLLPSIARENPAIDTKSTELKMLEQLSLLAATFLLLPHDTVLDKLVTAQHFGMKTRLLDWTSNPLVALWFACSEKADGDVYIYALDTEDLLFENLYKSDPFSHASTKVFQPRMNNPRIIAQDGWFTLHQFSQENQGWISLEQNKEISNKLMEFVIPEPTRKEMLNALNRHGTSVRTLFPDLAGVCQYINWKHQR